MAAKKMTGACACGEVRYEVEHPYGHACVCHCQSCRAAAGAPFVAWETFAAGTFRFLGAASRIYRSSPQVERGFCASCGTSLTYANADRSQEIDISITTLDDPLAVPPACHVWVADKLAWISIDDGLPQHAGWRSDESI